MEVNAYTKGEGRLSLSVKGYEPCHNQDEIVESIAYDPDKDAENLSSSVFCSKGVGYHVPWDQVEKHMHVQSGIDLSKTAGRQESSDTKRPSSDSGVQGITDQEVEDILLRTYGPSKKKDSGGPRIVYGKKKRSGDFDADHVSSRRSRQKPERERYLLVDGYNIIFHGMS